MREQRGPGPGATRVSLEVYVEPGCLTCRRSVALAREIQERFPQVEVRVLGVASTGGEHRRLVRAAPTYILNGVTFSLGNPSRGDLERAITRLLAGRDAGGPDV